MTGRFGVQGEAKRPGCWKMREEKAGIIWSQRDDQAW